MAPLLTAASLTLHSVAIIVFIGHYLLLSLVYLPALASEDQGAMALGRLSKRSRLWLYAALVLFILTGIQLMLVNPAYRGLGNFSDPWALLMLGKHLLIVVMLALGFWFNAIRRVGYLLRSNSGAAQGVAMFRRYSNVMAVCGVLVLLLTALAQIQ